ncbi:MAG: glycosyltransferase family 4 protein [Candidatus Sumerlaeales bacterium]|nr:glycosyltransferase family 4 protein [Candidatus Sumerlaeales bacterium]
MSEDKRSLRIMHFDTEMGWRGGEQQVCGLVEHLASLGHQSMIVCRRNSALHEYFGEKKMVMIVNMRGELDFISALCLLKHIRAFNPDIFHAHTGHAHSIALLTNRVAKLFLGRDIPVVVSRRVNFPLKTGWFSHRKYLSPSLSYVAVSEAVKQSLVRYGVPAQQVHVVHSGTDLSRFNNVHGKPSPEVAKILQDAGVSLNTKVIVSSCALSLLKDIPTLLYALAIVRRRMPDLDFKFINAGEGNMRGEWEKLRDDLGLGGLVYFAGFVSDIPCLLAQGDLFVLSTMSEGIAGSIIEAIASGLPVVATGIDGIPEIIQHEKNGLLSKPADPDSMAECIIRMLTQPEERQRMIDESKHIFDHDFTVDSMTAGNLNVYQSLLNK